MELQLALAKMVGGMEAADLSEKLRGWSFPHEHDLRVFVQDIVVAGGNVACRMFFERDLKYTSLRESVVAGEAVMDEGTLPTYKSVYVTFKYDGRVILRDGSSRCVKPLAELIDLVTVGTVAVFPLEIDPIKSARTFTDDGEPVRLAVSEMTVGDTMGRYEGKATDRDEATVLEIIEDGARVKDYTIRFQPSRQSSISFRSNGVVLIRDKHDAASSPSS